MELTQVNNQEIKKDRQISITLNGSFYPELEGKILNITEKDQNSVLISYNYSGKVVNIVDPDPNTIERIIEEVALKLI